MKNSFPEKNYTKYVHKSPLVQKSVNETKLDLSMTGLHVPQIKFFLFNSKNMTRKRNLQILSLLAWSQLTRAVFLT